MNKEKYLLTKISGFNKQLFRKDFKKELIGEIEIMLEDISLKKDSEIYFIILFNFYICCFLQSIYPKEFFDKNLDFISNMEVFLDIYKKGEIEFLFYILKREIKENNKLFNFPDVLYRNLGKYICNAIIKQQLTIFKSPLYKKYLFLKNNL